MKFTIIEFDKKRAQIVVKFDSGHTAPIDLPIDNDGRVPEGIELEEYIMGFEPVWEIERIEKCSKLKNAESIDALVDKSETRSKVNYTDTFASNANEKRLEIIKERDRRIALSIGTSLDNLVRHESHLNRLAFVANQILINPEDWFGVLFNGEKLPSTSEEITTVANKFIGEQIDRHIIIESIIIDFNNVLDTLATATENNDLGKIKW